ncbi:MAG: hypothetical protein M3Q07_11975 [Pseudobdellovibrionaceae bacterium]|nr:hypothetical protein [Pseudobdellovibrionaceae bacterium]
MNFIDQGGFAYARSPGDKEQLGLLAADHFFKCLFKKPDFLLPAIAFLAHGKIARHIP